MARIRGIAVTLLLLTSALVPMTLKAQDKLPPADLNRVKDGSVPPDFTLGDQDGNPVHLSNLIGKKKVVLVFYRGYW